MVQTFQFYLLLIGAHIMYNRVIQSCYLLATYHVTYFTTYLIRRTKRRPISDIMNLVDDYSGWPTYCPLLIGQLIQNPNSD
jgi:hypothetical protein